jgi:uncharacterized protein YndB with AHSA1/START domain
MALNITLSETIQITASPEKVWDYTQDYSHRREWDNSVLRAEIIEEDPALVVRLSVRGGMSFSFRYTQMDRPHKTSLALIDPSANWIVGGGGSWRYEGNGDGTLWTQTNTIHLRDSFVLRILQPLVVRMFRRNTRTAMKKAKSILESRSERSS